METIRFHGLQDEYAELKADIDSAMQAVMDRSEFILGPQTEAFEEEFAAFCQARYAVGLNSGTSALHLALLALDIGPGDEVITTPFTFYATVAAIHYAGARPVLADIDSRTFNLDPRRIEDQITERTKAILPVHLYGQPAAMDEILALARQYDLAVIEDAAQAHGAEYKGRRVGAIGDIGCFSFYPTKNLGAPGEGGMVVTNRPDYARKLRLLRDWGQERKYYPVMRGYNYRMSGIQAAALRVKLRRLEAWTEARRAHAAEYARLSTSLACPAAEGVRHVFHLFTIRSLGRDALQSHFAAHGVPTAVHYPLPVHLLPAYTDPRYSAGAFPVAEECSREVLSLPVHPFLTNEQIKHIVKVYESFSET